MEVSEKAEKLCAEASQLQAEMSPMVTYWQDAADYALPLRRLGFTNSGTPFRPDARLQSDVAVDALNTLASGMVSWVTPSRQNWFSWDPADELAGSDPVAEWLAECTRRAHRALENSNFYNVIHLAFLELGAFGTMAVYSEAGRDRALNFRLWHCGTFGCAENSEGQVDRVFRQFNLSAQQAIEKFGEKAPEKCRDDVKNNKRHTLHEFLHAVYPRSRKEQEAGKNALERMPVASCYLYPSKKLIVAEEGFASMPAQVSRWLKWSEDSPWGVSPAMLSIADIRGSNYLEMLLAAMANLKVNPRIIVPTGMPGTVDLGQGGITQAQTMQEAPQVWADPGEYRIGLDLADRVDARIKRAFHMPLFEQFSTLEREITATEVRARQAEQLARVSPAFTLLTTDLINPLLERVFMIMFENGHFPQPPREAFIQDAAGQWKLLFPKTVQVSRMAQAIEEQNLHAFASTVDTFFPLLQFDTSILDQLNLPFALRDIARGKGVPKGYLRTPEEAAAIGAQRAQQQLAQQAAEFAAKQPELAMAAAAEATGRAA